MNRFTPVARFFGGDRNRSVQPVHRVRRKLPPRRRALLFEPLENRILLSVSLFGIPNWLEQGPAPTTDGQVSAAPDDAVSGAVEALAAHPTNADILYAGGVTGGVWKTTNATSATPNWTPLTDQYPTLAISDLAFSPLDGTNNTLFAGTGGFSNGLFNGPAQGILRTTDGGATWDQLAQGTFTNRRIRSVVPTAIGTSLADQVVLVAAIDGGGGVFRSTDGGQTFSIVSGTSGSTDGLDNDADGSTDEGGELNLPTGAASYLAADPGNINRFYAAIPGQGIFRSDNGGANWIQVNNGLVLAGNNIELSVSSAAGNPVYAGFISGGVLANVFRSANQGALWTVIGVAPNITPGGQGFNDFSMLADNTDPNVVYVGGDRQPASPFVGNLFSGDASTNTWTDITDVLGTILTAPHADSRDMVFDANGDLLEADDGGIFRLTFDAILTFDIWSNLNRNLGVTEFYSTPYDHIQDVIFGGTQDTGSTRQTGAGSLTWDSVNLGDGNTAGVGYGEVLGIDFSVEYTMGNNFGTFERHFSLLALELLSGGQLGLGGLDGADSGFTGFTIFPYEVNAFDSARLVIGGINNLYESTDFGDNLTIITPAGVTGASAIAYGGSQGGVANPDVIYAGVGGNLFLRTTSGGAFSQLTAYTFGTPRDIVLDPDDWQGVYVTDGAAVYHSTDAGATWTTINNTGLSALTSGLNTVEVFSPTATVGDEILLAGSANGVFRTRNPSAGASALWSEFGADLPNAPVVDVQYDATDDILVAGTSGRGAWVVQSASTFLPVAGVIQIDGDTLFPGQDDIIKLIRDPDVPSLLNVFLNNLVTPELSVPIAAVEQINVNGLGGHDTLMVDSSNGLISVVNGIRYDGGAFDDILQLLQTGGPTQTSDTYSVGPAEGSGTSVIVGSGGGGTQTVFFEALSPVLDLVPALTLTVNATAGDNAISYSVGTLLTQGRVTIDEQESMEFASKTALTLNAGAGTDTVSVNNANTPTGLSSLTISGGDPTSGDTLVVTGVGGAAALNTGLGTLTGATGAAGAVAINFSGMEALNLSGVGALALTTTAADDTLVVTPGLTTGANSGLLQSTGVALVVSFTNAGAVTASLGAGTDTVEVHGSAGADTAAVSGAAVTITGRHFVNYTGGQFLSVHGQGGSDTFAVTPSTTVAIFIDGGDPIGGAGDQLDLLASGGVSFAVGPEADEGSFAVGANEPVSFDHIEAVSVTGGTAAVIEGTDAADAITVIARDVSTHAGTDGVQDFTVAVNAGPEILFVNAATLTVNALGGADAILVRAPAPNNAIWNVQVTVDGGPPPAASDQLVVETPGAGVETVEYTATGPAEGLLDLISLTSLITMTGVEGLIYEGRSDQDNLKVMGTVGPDTIVHTPGVGSQQGTVQVNDRLALSYQNLGASASLTVDGAADTDTLVMFGTSPNDTFTVAASGLVTLNTRLGVGTAGVETLTLEGLSGDDTFTLAGPLAGSAYSTVNLHGGVGTDRANLFGSAVADIFTINGPVIISGLTLNLTSVEDVRLDALGGIDALIYTGVPGVVEAILVSSSGVVGGGQLSSAPGVVQVTFTNLETIDVHGNVGVAGPEDTLTFAGTNGADVFQIDLAALGTDADPILQLQTGTGTPLTLLTLRNYTDFETLRVNGLDGADQFNVVTAPITPVNRDLFVDGGLPPGKRRNTDKLTVFYTPPRPSIIHSQATQDPDAGLVDLDYDTAQFVIQYDGIEATVITRLT